MPTDSEIYLDETIRHQVDVVRFGRTLAQDLVTEDETNQLLTIGALTVAFANRQNYVPILGRRQEHLRVMRDAFRADMRDFATAEAAREGRLLTTLRGAERGPTVQTVESVVREPYALGTTMADQFDDIIRRERVRLSRVARQARNESIDPLAAINQIFEQSKNELAALGRTAANHVSNSAREKTLEANDDIVRALRWNSVLDSRTSDICRARDGKMVAVGANTLPDGVEPLSPSGARPPAHPNCRSVMTVVLVGDEVPPDPTYQTWLKKQPAAFQDDVLGPTRGALFRRGGLTLDSFVDDVGKTFTLSELQQREPFAFDQANVRVETR